VRPAIQYAQEDSDVPTISKFFGVSIKMYYDEHGRAHFHAVYNEDSAVYFVESLKKMTGYLPPRVQAFVLEWAGEHQDELLENWDRCRNHEMPLPIEGLE
jgi:hypothetical protein